MVRISHAFTLNKVIRYDFVPDISYSFVPARKEEQFCTCTAPKLYRHSVSAREKEHFCVGSKVIRYSVSAREKEHFCIGSKVIRYSVSAREKEHFCIGSKVIRYSVNAALMPSLYHPAVLGMC